MKILKLFIQNVKRIKVVEITPKGSVVVLAGRNKQGKSSIIDSIIYVLGGKKLIGPKPVRKNEETAIVRAKIGDKTEEFEVKRRWTSSKDSILTVRSKDGLSPTDPQTFVDMRIGEVAFTPSEFINEEDDKKIEGIKKMLGIDFTALDKKYKQFYSSRHDVNRDLLKVQKESENYGALNEVETMRSITAIQAEYDKVMGQNYQFDQRVSTLNVLKSQNIALIAEIRKKEEQKLINIRKIGEIKEKMKVLPKVDITPLKAELVKAEGNSELTYKWKRKKELAVQVHNLQAETNRINGKMQKIAKQKEEMIDQIEIPIKGLKIEPDGITYKGIPLEETSHAEQLEIAVALLLAENPKIKIILIKHGEKFDDEAMEKIYSIARRRNLQIWLESVHSDDKDAIYIEDGMVKNE